MNRAVPWLVTAVALIGLSASLSETYRLRARLGEITAHKFHDHADVRHFTIRTALAEAPPSIVVFGDSVAEMAPIPREICGHAVINAGVGGMTIREATRFVGRVMDERGAFLVALAIGANDEGSARAGLDFAELIEAVKPLSTKPPVAISTAPSAQIGQQIGEAAAAAGIRFARPELPPGARMADGKHLTAAGYRAWMPALEAAIAKECG